MNIVHTVSVLHAMDQLNASIIISIFRTAPRWNWIFDIGLLHCSYNTHHADDVLKSWLEAILVKFKTDMSDKNEESDDLAKVFSHEQIINVEKLTSISEIQ